MTSAPKSDRITAAAGPATKLEKSTTLSSEKMLSLAIGSLLISRGHGFASPSVELGCTLLEEGGRAVLFVLRCGAQAEVGGFKRKAFALARLHSFVGGVERIFDGDRRVGGDFLEDSFCTRDQ